MSDGAGGITSVGGCGRFLENRRHAIFGQGQAVFPVETEKHIDHLWVELMAALPLDLGDGV